MFILTSLYPRKTNVLNGILKYACLSIRVCLSVHVFICQSAGGAIKSHLQTVIVLSIFIVQFKGIYLRSTEEQVLTTYSNLFQVCFLGTSHVLLPSVWPSEQSQS